MSVNALSGGHHCRGEWKVPGSMNSCNIITLDYRGSGEPVCGAWLAHHHPRRTGWTPLRRNSGRLSCLSARPPDLAVLAGARPQVLVVLPSSVPHLTVKRAARRRAPVQIMWSLWRSESFVSVSLYEVAELPRSLTLLTLTWTARVTWRQYYLQTGQPRRVRRRLRQNDNLRSGSKSAHLRAAQREARALQTHLLKTSNSLFSFKIEEAKVSRPPMRSACA